jgi:hypothetical protein
MIPLVYDIFKKQYPQILSQAIVLNYGWVHAGMWGVIKTVMSSEAKEKLKFLSIHDLQDVIPQKMIPFGIFQIIVDCGGNYYADSFKKSTFVTLYGRRLDTDGVQRVLTHVYENLCIDSDNNSTQEESEIYYDARSHISFHIDSPLKPKMVKSTADLQSLFPSLRSKGGANSLGRTLSSASLSNLAKHKSHVNLKRPNSYLSIPSKFEYQQNKRENNESRPPSSSKSTRNSIVLLIAMASGIFPKTRIKRKIFLLLLSFFSIIFLKKLNFRRHFLTLK